MYANWQSGQAQTLLSVGSNPSIATNKLNMDFSELQNVVEWTALAEDPEGKEADEKVSVFAPADSTNLTLLAMFEARFPTKKFCTCSFKQKDYQAPVIDGGFGSSFWKDLRPD